MRSARRKPIILVSPMPDKLPTPVNIGTSFERRQLATPTDIIDVAEKSSTSNSVRACFLEQLVFLEDVEATEIQFLKTAVTRSAPLGSM
jgi:hypothetical protein